MINQAQLDSTRKLSILIAEIEARNEQTSQQHQQAMETLCLAIRDIQQLAGRISKQTLEEFWRSAGIALKDSLGESMGFRNVIVRWPKQHVTVIMLTNRNEPEPYRTALQVAGPYLKK